MKRWNREINGSRVRVAVTSAIVSAIAVIAGCSEPAAQNVPEAAPPTPPAMEKSADAGSENKVNHQGHAMSGHEGHVMGTKGMDALKALKGKAFDIAFLSQMITHHEAAVKMAQDALKSASRETTKAEGQKVIDAQTKEIAQMRQWLKDWHGAEPDATQQKLVTDDMAGMMAMPIAKDADFYAMMIPHHQGAIDMSELVPTRGEKAEVKKLAQQIIAAQRAEIETYRKELASK
jgi:uncharacterized protein (DUF305 family)